MQFMDVAAEAEGPRKKPRLVISFETREEHDAMRAYAKDKGLDLKNFFMWLAKTHMTRYPQKAAQNHEGG